MIIHKFNPKKGFIVLTPEDEDDLWALRRVIEQGDLLTTHATRSIKQQGEFVRPDKGKRIPVRLTLEVEKASIDSSLGRLRVFGRIFEASDESVKKGAHHSFIITPDKQIELQKNAFSNLHLNILKASSTSEPSFIIVALDRREAAVARVKGSHLTIITNIESHAAGKAFPEAAATQTYYQKILEALRSSVRECEKIYIVGPGATKNALANVIKEADKKMGSKVLVLEGIDVAGEDGARMALKSPTLQTLLKDSKLIKASSLVKEILLRISKNDNRVAIGLDDVVKASEVGAVECLLISDKAFEDERNEERLVHVLNKVESSRGQIYLMDSSTEVGLQVSALGGVAALLRYAVSS
ncbi:MAG: mRNA surveillance protein pelota [Nitrososphaerales archaeon]